MIGISPYRTRTGDHSVDGLVLVGFGAYLGLKVLVICTIHNRNTFPQLNRVLVIIKV